MGEVRLEAAAEGEGPEREGRVREEQQEVRYLVLEGRLEAVSSWVGSCG